MFAHLKSAPASAVLGKILGGNRLPKEQQLQVLENRREILVRCMKTFSQKSLGQLVCMDSGNGFYHELYKDNPQVVSLDEKFSLDTRGLYAGNSFSRTKGGQRLAFGIDQESWLLVKINYLNKEREREWPHKHEKATSVQIARVDLPAILQEMEIDGRLVWDYFKIVTDEWVSHRKTLYDQALNVAEGMKEESAILRLVTWE